MTNKVLVKLYVPAIEKEYDIWIPINLKIHKITSLLVKSVNELSGGFYTPSVAPLLYDKKSALLYDVNCNVKENNILNGTEMILI